MTDSPWTTLNKMLRDYERTGSLSLTALVRAALPCAESQDLVDELARRGVPLSVRLAPDDDRRGVTP